MKKIFSFIFATVVFSLSSVRAWSLGHAGFLIENGKIAFTGGVWNDSDSTFVGIYDAEGEFLDGVSSLEVRLELREDSVGANGGAMFEGYTKVYKVGLRKPESRFTKLVMRNHDNGTLSINLENNGQKVVWELEVVVVDEHGLAKADEAILLKPNEPKDFPGLKGIIVENQENIWGTFSDPSGKSFASLSFHMTKFDERGASGHVIITGLDGIASQLPAELTRAENTSFLTAILGLPGRRFKFIIKH
jgi:hypothetical protein